MISERAMQGIDEILIRAVRSRLVLHPDDRCEFALTRLQDASGLSAQDFVVLTISSIGFRMLTMVHIDDNEQTRRYYGRGSPELAFMDIFFEVANLFCGAMNQELVSYFPDLGMSTPYYLDGRCASHVSGLKPAYLASYAITINDDVRLTASVCVCAHLPLDFKLADNQPVQATGELELF